MPAPSARHPRSAILFIIGMCMAWSGIGFAAVFVGATVMEVLRGRDDGLSEMILCGPPAGAIGVGIPVGLLCSPVAVYALQRKRLRDAYRFLMWKMSITSALLPLFGLLHEDLLVLALVVAAGAVHVFCLIARDSLRDRLYETMYPHCAGCGYDLRGTVSDRCSECGTPVLVTDPQIKARFDAMLAEGATIRIAHYSDGLWEVAIRDSGLHTVSGHDLHRVVDVGDSERKLSFPSNIDV